MKLVVVSDNHGLQNELPRLRLIHNDADAFFHCGDSELPIAYLDDFIGVLGNNDYYLDLPETKVIDLKEIRVLLTHGHRYLYFNDLNRLVAKAKQENCQLVLYGHTHLFRWSIIDGIHLVNPGSLSHNRDGSAPSYAIVTIENGEISVKRMER